MLGTVTMCVRYPVKSMLGEEVDRLVLGWGGVQSDRRWALRTERNKIGSGKTNNRFDRLARLFEMSAWLDSDGMAVVRLPGGRTVSVSDPAVHSALSSVVGQPVTVIEPHDAVRLGVAPVHLVTTASLRWWAAQVPGTQVDWRRARPNLVLDVAGDDRVEDDWVGVRFVVGSATLQVIQRTERCVMVGAEQAELPADLRLLKTLAPMDLTLGVYAVVIQPGECRVGDPARRL